MGFKGLHTSEHADIFYTFSRGKGPHHLSDLEGAQTHRLRITFGLSVTGDCLVAELDRIFITPAALFPIPTQCQQKEGIWSESPETPGLLCFLRFLASWYTQVRAFLMHERHREVRF